MIQSEKMIVLEQLLKPLYDQNKEKLLFHGWHHIIFVKNKTRLIAQGMNIDSLIIESAALVHDLNYIVRPNSEPGEGKSLREEHLSRAGYDDQEISRIEEIVRESHTATRSENISVEAKILSDADTLFKSLPITPIIFANKYITENNVDIAKLAKKVVDEQIPLLQKDIYFYTDFAKKNYLKWAKTNLELWQNVLECLEDKDIQQTLELAKSGI